MTRYRDMPTRKLKRMYLKAYKGVWRYQRYLGGKTRFHPDFKWFNDQLAAYRKDVTAYAEELKRRGWGA